MKRNILLLTVVVLAALMLTGCMEGLFGKVAIKWDVPANTFVKTDLIKNTKKSQPEFSVNVKYLADVTVNALEWTWTATSGKEDLGEAFIVSEYKVDGEVVGITLSFPVEKAKIEIKAVVPAAE